MVMDGKLIEMNKALMNLEEQLKAKEAILEQTINVLSNLPVHPRNSFVSVEIIFKIDLFWFCELFSFKINQGL